MSHSAEPTHTEKGASLARGPAWIVGSVLAVFGLVFFFRAGGTPLSVDAFPKGDPAGPSFLGIEVNGWTAWLTAAAGVLVLIGALQHVIAKAMSLAVGIALAIATGMALVAGDVLGLAAANSFTAIGWGVAAALLIATALLPRRTHEVADRRGDRNTDHHDRIQASRGAFVGDHGAAAPPVATRDSRASADRDDGATTPTSTITGRRHA